MLRSAPNSTTSLHPVEFVLRRNRCARSIMEYHIEAASSIPLLRRAAHRQLRTARCSPTHRTSPKKSPHQRTLYLGKLRRAAEHAAHASHQPIGPRRGNLRPHACSTRDGERRPLRTARCLLTGPRRRKLRTQVPSSMARRPFRKACGALPIGTASSPRKPPPPRAFHLGRRRGHARSTLDGVRGGNHLAE